MNPGRTTILAILLLNSAAIGGERVEEWEAAVQSNFAGLYPGRLHHIVNKIEVDGFHRKTQALRSRNHNHGGRRFMSKKL